MDADYRPDVVGPILRRHFICLPRTMRALLPRAYGSATAAGSCIDTEGIDAVYRPRRKPGESDISLCLVGVHGHPVGTALADAGLLELFEIFTADSDT